MYTSVATDTLRVQGGSVTAAEKHNSKKLTLGIQLSPDYLAAYSFTDRTNNT